MTLRARKSSKQGFTLLELLVAVAIFAGIAVLTLAIFARTAASSAKANKSRQRTEAVRTIVDRISSDFRYVYLDKEITNNLHGQITPCVTSGQMLGYQFTNNCLELVLKYPGSDTLTWKKYYSYTEGVGPAARTSFYVQEGRNCTINGSNQLSGCQPNPIPAGQELLNGRYQLDGTKYFSGLSPIQAGSSSTGLLSLNFSLKPTGQTKSCSENSLECYTIKTTLAAGGR